MWKTVLRFFVQIEQSVYFIQQKKVFQFRKLLRICMYIVQDGENSKVGKKLTCSEFAYICTIWQIFKFKVQIPYTKNGIRVEKLNAYVTKSSPFYLILQNIIYNINGVGGKLVEQNCSSLYYHVTTKKTCKSKFRTYNLTFRRSCARNFNR